MTPLLLLSFAALPLLSSSRSIFAPRQYSYPDSGSQPSPSGSDSASSPSTTSGSSSSTGDSTTGTFQGDGTCFSTMCITATVENDNVNYQLTSTEDEVGWMAMGWGTQMPNSPMVIMWSNGNGDVTLSQRIATARVQPSVDPNPPAAATLSTTLFEEDTQGKTAFAFSVPYDGQGEVPMIWAFGTTTPSSSEVDAQLQQHSIMGRFSLDLSKSSDSNPHSIVSGGASQAATSRPLETYEKMLVAHALLCTLGFLVFLSSGALLARLWRTFSNKWFKGHETLQFFIAGPTIIIGIGLGIAATEQAGDEHLATKHKKGGIALLVLYILQISLGFIIHKFKTKSGKRPPQNYLHAIFGLAIIGLAFWQVRNGFKVEFPSFTGREVSNAANIIWIIWAAIVVIAYFGGLAFLPKQFRQEKEYRAQKAMQ